MAKTRTKTTGRKPRSLTAAAGVEIYRGDSLPSDLVGDLFFNEPVARIVRRAKVVETMPG